MSKTLSCYMGQKKVGLSSGHSEAMTYMDKLNAEIAVTEAQGKYHYLNPKKEKVIPHEYVVQTLVRGSGYEGGRQRIYEIYQDISSPKERAVRLKKEYGQGGASWPLEGYGLHGYDTFKPKGIRLRWRDEEGEKEGYLSWKTVEAEIGALMLTGQYYTPHISMDEFAAENREDMIDAEYKEAEEEPQTLTDDEIEEILEADRRRADERYEKQLEEAGAAEDAPHSLENDFLTPDIQEKGVHSISEIEFKYIEPIDYKKVIAELDEEVREALEILVASCSIYTPFHPFLQALVNTEDLLMPNKLDLLTDIILQEGEESRYNALGSLIEYKIKPHSISLSYYGRDKEKKDVETGSRIVYEVLSYMAKKEGYCTKERREQFEKELAVGDRTKLNLVYRKFLEKQEEARERKQADRQVSKSENPVLERKLLSRYSIQEDISESNEPMFRIYDKEEQRLYQDAFGEIPRFRSWDKADYYLHHAVGKRMFPHKGDKPQPDRGKKPHTEKAVNYRIRTLSEEPAGAKTRFLWNVDAIRTLKKIEIAGRHATLEEQEIMAKYVGWGGLSQAFDESNESWGKEYKQLKELLSEGEYRAARETVTNAFYTPPEVTGAIYAALERFGFQQGNILEPSAGIGNFFGSLPESMADSRLYGVEKDSISGRIAKQLYPRADIRIEGFEKAGFEDNFFDVAVGNVP